MSTEEVRMSSLYDVVAAGEVLEVVYFPTVCIIESPSEVDRREGRREGNAIAESLRLGQISHRVFDVFDRPELNQAFDEIAEFACIRKSAPSFDHPPQVQVPRLFVHISCHGDDNGVTLTDRSVIEWNELGELLLAMASKCRLFAPTVAPFANLTVVMSSCRGLHARQMVTNTHACPFLSLIGCRENILWSDAATAFGTFYHQAIGKNRSIPRTVDGMNAAALARNPFELVTAKDLGVPGFGDSPMVVLMSADSLGRMAWVFDVRRNRPEIPFIWEKDLLFLPGTDEPILDPMTGNIPVFFDDPAEAVAFMQANRERMCQVERCAAQEIELRFAHRHGQA